MWNIGLNTPAQVTDGFMPAMGDRIDIGAEVYADTFNILEESGDALGQTVRIEIANNGVTDQIIFTGIGLADLDLPNITAVNQGVANEIAAALGTGIGTPGDRR